MVKSLICFKKSHGSFSCVHLPWVKILSLSYPLTFPASLLKMEFGCVQRRLRVLLTWRKECWFSEVHWQHTLASGLVSTTDSASYICSSEPVVNSLGSGNILWEHWPYPSCWHCHPSALIGLSLCPVFLRALGLTVHPSPCFCCEGTSPAITPIVVSIHGL